MTTELLKQWQTFISSIDKNNNLLNGPISENETDQLISSLQNIPVDLLQLLQFSNGQKTNSEPIFIKLNGATTLKYKFLTGLEIISLYKFIQDTTNSFIDKNLIPFAKYEKDIGDKGSMAFAINKVDNTVHHLLFYEFDRFTTVYEHRSEIFSKSLLDFISSENEWHKVTSS